MCSLTIFFIFFFIWWLLDVPKRRDPVMFSTVLQHGGSELRNSLLLKFESEILSHSCLKYDFSYSTVSVVTTEKKFLFKRRNHWLQGAGWVGSSSFRPSVQFFDLLNFSAQPAIMLVLAYIHLTYSVMCHSINRKHLLLIQFANDTRRLTTKVARWLRFTLLTLP